MFALIAVLLVILLLKYVRNVKYSHFPGPSSMLSLPMVGHAHLLGADPCESLLKMQKKYGDVFR